VRDLFASIDTDRNELVSQEELKAALVECRRDGDGSLAEVLEGLLSKAEGGISFDQFFAAFQELPRVREWCGGEIDWPAVVGAGVGVAGAGLVCSAMAFFGLRRRTDPAQWIISHLQQRGMVA
jgi:hypothetical protein